MFRHAGVHAFVAAADQHQTVQVRRPFPGDTLIVLPARCRHHHDPRSGSALRQNRFHRREHRFGLQQHALATAKRPVVHHAMLVERPVSKIVHFDSEQSGLYRLADHPVREWTAKKLREDRDDIELQFKSRRPSGKSSVTFRPSTSISRKISRLKGTRNGLPPACSTSNQLRPGPSCQPATVPIFAPCGS